MQVRVEVRRHGKLLDPAAADATVKHAINTALRGAGEYASAEVAKATPVGVTSFLRRAWAVDHRPRELMVRVVNIEEYGPVLEGGRRPGKRFPPVFAIQLWVKRVLGISDEKEIRSVAFLVGRKIARHGSDRHKGFARASFDRSLAVIQRGTLGDGLTLGIVRALES